MTATEDIPIPPGMTLKQFCRALAAHLLLSTHPDLLHSVMAPETAEKTAEIIHRFALGERMARGGLGRDEED